MLAARASALRPRTVTLEGMGQEDARAEQSQECRNRLNHRKSPFAPRGERTTRAPAQSKGFLPSGEDGTRLMLLHNRSVAADLGERAGQGPGRND